MGTKQISADCYKCTAKTDTYEDVIHPLCDACQIDFEQWLWEQMKATQVGEVR